MLQHTFSHLPRIGIPTERILWQSGIKTWDDFLVSENIPRIARKRKPFFDRAVQETKQAAQSKNAKYFASLKSQLIWRLWPLFEQEACFVDIETDHRNNITVLGISDGEQVWQFVRGMNLDKELVTTVLEKFSLIVTFNGASFDLPIIRRYFGNIIPDIPHLDLRHAAARANLSGGLKNIEIEVGIARPDDVANVSGMDAIRLWHLYRHTGEQEHLRILLDYNAEDIVNLRALGNIVYDRLRKKMQSDMEVTKIINDNF